MARPVELVVTMAQGLSNLSHSRVPALPAPMASVSQLGPGGARNRALLVDDAPDVLVVVGAFLRSGGYDVVRAHDAEAALNALRRDEPLDVLVTDYAMPGMSGLELVRRARDLRPGLAAVVITAFAADLALDAGRPSGVTVLAKPFARAELLNAVRAVCTGAEAGAREA